MNSTQYTQRVDEIVLLLTSGHEKQAVARFTRLDAALPNVASATIESNIKTAVFRKVGPRVDKIMSNFYVALQRQLVTA